jgi:DNA invertase Pin-like site-specific DNA recombinase
MKVVGYVRVSTERQAEVGLGLEVQEQAILSWAQERGHVLVAVLRDEGISGTREAADRPGLSAALNALEDGEADGVVVARLDRLARSLTVQEAVLATVWRAGGKVFSVDVGEVLEDDPDDPMRTFVRQVMGAAAQLERGMIAARLRDGRRRKHMTGGYAYGSPPFGYRAEGRALVPVLEEQATIRRMSELHAEGRSFRAIAAQLDREGLPARRGGRWHGRQVGRILGSERSASRLEEPAA